MKGRKFLIAMAVASIALIGMPGHATNNVCSGAQCTNTQGAGEAARTVEPLATRSSLAVVYDDQVWTTGPDLGGASIASWTLNGSGGFLTATITTEDAMPLGADPLADITRYPPTYAGIHVMMTFQTNWIEVNQTIGAGPDGIPGNEDDNKWNDSTGAAYSADGFRWFIYYGATLNHTGRQCGLGFYDPSGRLDPLVPVGIGQVFFIVGQKQSDGVSGNNASCTHSNGGRTVQVRIPHVYQWETSTGAARAVRIVGNAPGAPANPTQVRNMTAFSWMDTEGGAPTVDQDLPDNPTGVPDVDNEIPNEIHEGGLILGLTWYTDAEPKAYSYGLIAGDPNPAKLPTERCTTNALGGVPELPPPYNTTGPCMINNPVGTGFGNTSGTLTVS